MRLLACNSPAGAKIHQSNGKIHCIEEGGVNHTLEEGSQIPETVTASYQHTQTVYGMSLRLYEALSIVTLNVCICVCLVQCLQKCRDIEAAISSLEQQSSDGSYFPVTVRRCV